MPGLEIVTGNLAHRLFGAGGFQAVTIGEAVAEKLTHGASRIDLSFFALSRFAESAPDVAAATNAANPMGRMGDPETDIGGVAVFLASEDARYLTGNTLFVDGGSHINGVPWLPQPKAR